MAVGSHSGSDSMSYPLAAAKVLPEAKMLPEAKILSEAKLDLDSKLSHYRMQKCFRKH